MSGSRLTRACVALLSALAGSACISTWNQYPPASRDTLAGQSFPQTLHYDISEVRGMFGGAEALRRVFRQEAPFATREPRSEPPNGGLFVRVESQRIPPHTGSGVIGYISYVFLLTIPFRSTEGYTMRYQVFIDGAETKLLEYDITRRTYYWLLAAPFSWVSLLTPSESDAFEATGYQFFEDAAPYLRGDRSWSAARSHAPIGKRAKVRPGTVR